jgi:hypothetical protein
MEGGAARAAVPGLQIGDGECRLCKLFVIESAVHLAELEFDLDLRAGNRGNWRSLPGELTS